MAEDGNQTDGQGQSYTFSLWRGIKIHCWMCRFGRKTIHCQISSPTITLDSFDTAIFTYFPCINTVHSENIPLFRGFPLSAKIVETKGSCFEPIYERMYVKIWCLLNRERGVSSFFSWFPLFFKTSMFSCLTNSSYFLMPSLINLRRT